VTGLPGGFEELQEFLGTWDGATTDERVAIRVACPMPEIRRFYDAATPRAEAALDLLSSRPLDALTFEEQALLRLMLGLAQASVAVEIHGAPGAPNAPPKHGVHVEHGPAPFG